MSGCGSESSSVSFELNEPAVMNFIKYLFACCAVMFHLANDAGAQDIASADEKFRLAEQYRGNSKPDSALLYYQTSAEEFKKLGLTEKFIAASNQAAAILTRQDKYDLAKPILQKALAEGLAKLDSNHLGIAGTWLGLGVLYAGEKNYDQSLIFHHKALDIRILKLGDVHADVATSYGNIGNVYFNKKDFIKSIEAHLAAMKIRENIFGRTSVEVIQSYTNLGNAYGENKEYATSLEYFNKSLQNKIAQVGENHKDLSPFYKRISDVHYLMNNAEQGDYYKNKSTQVSKKE
jgi:tetratricopeptide (TPR) repeat protein